MNLPPQPPVAAVHRHRAEADALKRSAILHGILALAVTIQSVFFVTKPKPLISTLRVDLVGLPDRGKPRPLPPGEKPGGAPEKTVTEPAPERPVPLTKPEPKSTEVKVQKKPEIDKRDELSASTKVDPKKRMKSAVAKIRALEKIRQLEVADSKSKRPGAGELVKGNFISKGNSLSGDAREGDAPHYYETIRDRLQEYWELPSWLAKSDLTAQVRIHLDRSGRVIRLAFTRSSGNPQFDEAVKQCVAKSQPLPSPPDDLKGAVFVDGISVGFPL